jgi:catechol 2,3-dioxygenase-like lactoylglutathione lyase family enzyme
MANSLAQNELTDSNGRRILRPTLAHTSNYTTRVDELLQWYRNVVGMEITSSPRVLPGHFVSNDTAHHRMSFFHLPDMKPDVVRDAAGVNHVAFEYETVDELLETWTRLHALGIIPHTTVDHGPTYSFYYWDPDGNNVELFTDAFGDPEKSMEFFQTDERFQKNPMGNEVDPARMIEARHNGVTYAEMHKAAMQGEFGKESAPVGDWDGWREKLGN